MSSAAQPRAGHARPINGAVAVLESNALPESSSPRVVLPKNHSFLPPPHPNTHRQPRPASPAATAPLIPRSTLVSRGPPASLTPKAHAVSAVVNTPAPSSSSSSASLGTNRRRLVAFAAGIGLLLAFPVIYMLSSSALLANTLSTSLISTQPTSLLKSLSPLSPSPSLSSPTPFLFPRPTPWTFIASHPDATASLSQQFAQWLYGPYLSLTLNISYAYTPFLKLSSRYASFLGFGFGEWTEADLLGEFARTRIFIRNVDTPDGDGAPVAEWIMEKQKKVDAINRKLIEHHSRAQSSSLPPLVVDEPKGSYIDGFSTKHVNPDNPVDTATVFRLYRVPVPSLLHACYPPLHQLLRQKYCAARVRHPIVHDLYDEDRRAGHMIVAIHILCGEVCYTDKTLPLTSCATTMHKLTETAEKHALPSPVFHIFSSPPWNSTADYFSPLLSSSTRLHLDHHSHHVFHHLVTSDVLLAPALGASSTSWLVQVLHAGVVIGPSVPQHACVGEVGMYSKDTGWFDEEDFVKVWKQTGGHVQRYDELHHCAAINMIQHK